MARPRFYDTLSRATVSLEPLEERRVRLYTCGPTVYDRVHIGNLRTFLFEDVLRRSLKYLGYEVVQVMNLTDVDDKTIREANETGVTLAEYTEPYIESFFDDLDTLGMERAEEYPRATEHIQEMIDLVQRLVDNGHAYVQEGSVFFRIASDEDYGKLSGVDISEVRSGERVAADEYDKEDVRDFVLWKAAKPGEPSWESPWGPGRPGWHIECSAMSMCYLGESFDIHCGGVDNIFPHHDNEIAQSESATGKPFVRLWLHSEHLIVEGQKMSKSLGNFYTLKDLLERGEDPRTIRYLLLSVHYRQKLNFTFDALESAAAALRRLDEHRFRLEQAPETGKPRSRARELAETLEREFQEALADDLNVSAALAALFRYVKGTNILMEEEGLGEGDRELLLAPLERIDEVLGVLDPGKWREERTKEGLSEAEIQRRIEEREEARRERDFVRADRIRDELRDEGVVLEDTPDGTRWKRE